MLNNLSEVGRLEYFSNIYTNLGMESFEKVQYQRAFMLFNEAIARIEDLKLEHLKNSGGRTHEIQKLDAIKSDIKQKIVHIFKTFGYESWEKKDYVTAIVYFEEALKLNPNDANLCNTVAFMYKNVGYKFQNIDKQIEFLEKAIELDPNHMQAIRSLAVTYPFAGRNQEAIEYFHKLFKLEAVADDYMAYAQLKIQMGDFKEGWKHYENRFLIEFSTLEYPTIEKPRWEGQNIFDKTLLVQYEQGFGDSIQFFRYVEQVKPFAKKIIFRVQNDLVDLLKINASDLEIVGMSTPLSELEFDYHVPLLSLPYLLGASIDDIPLAEGYINADADKVKYYKEKFFDNNCLKIGISYNGARFGNAFRDIELEAFYSLTKIKNVKIYSFQKGFGSEQLEKLPPDIEVVDLGKTFDDFSDTAAAMANLDLFVTSDNGVFNLAAAMGKETFLLLNKHSEWRWFFDEETTPWYQSVKIFKKPNEDVTWDTLMQKVVEVVSPSEF